MVFPSFIKSTSFSKYLSILHPPSLNIDIVVVLS
nr:MAG TPA: hypothetical protein [Caudoviricetes sp.]